MKINRLRGSGDGRKTEMGKNDEILERQSSPPIKVAISVQKLWKSAGLVFQGILGGMALMHFIMASFCYIKNASVPLKSFSFNDYI